MSDWVLSLSMLAGLALIAGAIALWLRKERRRALLMAAAALVLLADVAIWSLPEPGAAPAAQRAQ